MKISQPKHNHFNKQMQLSIDVVIFKIFKEVKILKHVELSQPFEVDKSVAELTCVNENECDDDSHDCATTENCQDTPGSWTCSCKSNYMENIDVATQTTTPCIKVDFCDRSDPADNYDCSNIRIECPQEIFLPPFKTLACFFKLFVFS